MDDGKFGEAERLDIETVRSAGWSGSSLQVGGGDA